MSKLLFGIALLGSILSIGTAAYYSSKKEREYQQQIQQMKQQVEQKEAKIKEKQQQLENRDSEIEILANEYNQTISAKKRELVEMESKCIGIASVAARLCDCIDSLNQEREEYKKKSIEELNDLMEDAEGWNFRRDLKKEDIQMLTNSNYK